MHRMRRYLVLVSLVSASVIAGGQSASADLSHPSSDPQTYPDIVANLGKGVSYTYDSAAENGVFHLKNTAYAIVTGPGADDQFDISPTADGSRFQELSVTLDKNGGFVNNTSNLYQVYGSITANGQTYSGLLLSGKPIDFSSSVVNGVTQFQTDLQLNSTGLLSSMFGANPFIHLVAETGNGFTGSFANDFAITKVSSNTHGSDLNGQPFPIPEPTTLAFLALSGVGLVYRNRRQRSR